MKRTRFCIFLAFLIVILASFSGCGNGEGDIATGGEAGEKSEIVIGYVGHYWSYLYLQLPLTG